MNHRKISIESDRSSDDATASEQTIERVDQFVCCNIFSLISDEIVILRSMKNVS